MTHALQVNFRRLLPSERLVSLASERYQHIRNARPDTRECWVTLETLSNAQGQPVQAAVAVHGEDGPICETTAVHPKPHVALSLAMAQAQIRLGVRPEVTPLYWSQRHPASDMRRLAMP